MPSTGSRWLERSKQLLGRRKKFGQPISDSDVVVSDPTALTTTDFGNRSLFLELQGFLHEAEIAPAFDLTTIDTHDTPKVECFTVVFGHGDKEFPTQFSDETYTHGIISAADDGPDLWQRIVPLITAKGPLPKWFSLPVWYREGELQGTLLEEVDISWLEVEDRRISLEFGDYSDSLRSFVRVAKFARGNLLSGEPVDIASLMKGKKERVKLL